MLRVWDDLYVLEPRPIDRLYRVPHGGAVAISSSLVG